MEGGTGWHRNPPEVIDPSTARPTPTQEVLNLRGCNVSKVHKLIPNYEEKGLTFDLKK